MTETTGLRFHLLGPLRIERAGEALHLPRRKVEALVAYLLLRPERHTRDQLATLFWGDASDSQARHSLRTALATIRKEVAPELVLADRDLVQRNPAFPCWIDLYELLALEPLLETVDGEVLLGKVALWQGALLAGHYDDWLLQEREHYQARLLALLLRATQALRTRSDYPRAIAVAQTILAHDPADEHAHQHLIFCHMATGDRGAALRQYEQCVRLLESELDAPPAAETTALYRWILQQEGEAASPAARVTNLPIPLTSFIGRMEESSAVKRLLDPAASAARLVTLTGAGGSGKTRLAIQVATDLIDRYVHGVWWVELGALARDDQVAQAVARALGVVEAANKPCLEAIVEFVGEKTLLLLLDNCEHLSQAVASLAAGLLSRCRNLRLLATSREALNLAGEVRWQVPALALPDHQTTALETLQQYACLRLFAERAAAVQNGFQLTKENALAVADICARLDGIPLAIELAAARVRMLPVEEIATRLAGAFGARFALLTQGSRVAQPRHQTLRAAIDWSYALLDETERRLFCQAAIFRGGFTLDALAAVAVPDGGPQEALSALLDLLGQLVDKSLILAEPHGVGPRYRMLETLREYALGCFPSAEALTQVQHRHATCYRRLAEAAAPELIGAQQHVWLKRLEDEHPNSRAALDFLLATQAKTEALQLATALHRFWDVRGYIGEGRAWLRKALERPWDAQAETVGWALTAAAWLAYRQGDFDEARRMLLEAMHLFRQVEAAFGLVDAMQILAVVDFYQGDYAQAARYLTQSLELASELDYAYGMARGLKYQGSLAWDQDRIEEARRDYRASLALYRQLGDLVSIANLHLNVGDAERLLHELDAAEANYDECIRRAHELGHKGLVGAARKSLSMLAFARRDYDQSRRHGEEALRIFRELGDKPHIGFTLSNLGDVAMATGDSHQALRDFGACLQIMHEVGYKWPLFAALEDIAQVLDHVGQHLVTAAHCLGAAAHLRTETGIPVPPDQQARYATLLASVRSRLGEGAFAAAWQEGEVTPLDRIVAEAAHLTIA